MKVRISLYRNQKILDLARECERCQSCQSTSPTIVAAHSNQLRDGKGRGLKAHDYRVAYLCYECHTEIDQGKLSKEEKRELWEDAHRRTIGWLFENNHIKII